MLTVSVRSIPVELSHFDCSQNAVAVIDVLRATSVMATALHNGASRIYTRAQMDQARQLKKMLNDEALLCGERGGKRIDGFDLGNSPFEFMGKMIESKNLIMCTTNGTKAVEAALGSAVVVALSFVNLHAATELLWSTGLDIELLCAGTNGKFSTDDALCAGMVIAKLREKTELKTNDLGHLLLNFALQSGTIAEKLHYCAHKRFLESMGYGRDVEFCLTPDLFNTVPLLSPEGFFLPANG